MTPLQHGLTPAEYLRFRERYLPEHPKIIFVLESPPKSGKFFYNPEGLVSEPLFSAMMKDILEIKPSTKDEGLREFALLVDELRKCSAPDTKLILVKANVCRLLDSKLTGAGFTVLNHGKSIPFPSTGPQRKFRDAVRLVLGSES